MQFVIRSFLSQLANKIATDTIVKFMCSHITFTLCQFQHLVHIKFTLCKLKLIQRHIKLVWCYITLIIIIIISISYSVKNKSNVFPVTSNYITSSWCDATSNLSLSLQFHILLIKSNVFPVTSICMTSNKNNSDSNSLPKFTTPPHQSTIPMKQVNPNFDRSQHSLSQFFSCSHVQVCNNK